MTNPQGDRSKPTTADAPSTGFVLADSSLRPIYANAEAVKILAYPNSPNKGKAFEKFLVERIQALFPPRLSPSESAVVTRITSGRRSYLCRIFFVPPSLRRGSQPAIVLLMERNSRSPDLLQMAEEYKLTQREREAVDLLAQGLTSKEIANRMGISPNTVKAFLRLVMVKTGVTTRSGIIGKFIHSRA